MLVRFFTDLRAGGVPVTLPEFLGLLEALEARRRGAVARGVLLPRAHGAGEGRAAFRPLRPGVRRALRGRGEAVREARRPSCPPNGCKQLTERLLSEEEKRRVEALGGWDKLLETLRQRLREQQGRHEGGNKWIGTAGTSPFGNQGFNPEGVRIGPGGLAPSARGQGLGGARLSQSRRRRRARHAQSQDGAAAPAPFRARRRAPKSSTSTAPSTPRRAMPGLLDLKLRARAAQRGEAAVAARRGRLDGSARARSAKSCSRRRAPSSSTSNISTSTISRTNACGRTTAAGSA